MGDTKNADAVANLAAKATETLARRVGVRKPDDGGDLEPGGTILGEPTITRFSGLHQLATATNEEICASIAAALGG